MNASSEDRVVWVSGLCTRFGRQVVHDGLDLEVRRGEVFGIVGGSGAGKSVLLRCILGLTRPERGEIEVLGQRIGRLDARTRSDLQARQGVLFQGGALFSSLTVAENVALPLRERARLGRTLLDELAALKIALVGLPTSAGPKYPSQLSGGMRRRAALARAIALDPELLFLDEPSAGLDPESARAFEELIRHLNELLGLTVFVVTRDLGLLWNAADHVAFLGAGRVVAAGTMEEVSRADEPLVRSYFSGMRGGAQGEQR